MAPVQRMHLALQSSSGAGGNKDESLPQASVSVTQTSRCDLSIGLPVLISQTSASHPAKRVYPTWGSSSCGSTHSADGVIAVCCTQRHSLAAHSCCSNRVTHCSGQQWDALAVNPAMGGLSSAAGRRSNGYPLSRFGNPASQTNPSQIWLPVVYKPTDPDKGQRQAKANQAGQDLLFAAVEDILSSPASRRGPFSVADIGCSVGNNSLPELAAVVRCLDEQGARDREVSITHVDQLSNNWQHLFEALASASGGYPKVRSLNQGGPVFSYGLARDMYLQCFPTSSLHLVYSGITFHWGSSAVNVIDHVVAQYSADEHVRRAAEAQGHADLLQWLQMRAKELKSGGHLIATAIGTSDEASYQSVRQIFDISYKCWSQLHSDGLITQMEYARACFPLYLFDLADALKLIQQELAGTFEVVNSSAGAGSTVAALATSASAEERSSVAAATCMAAIAPGFRQQISGRCEAEQESILQGLKQAVQREFIAAKFVPSTQYILLALRRK
ncbi:hypothetical protein WJX74_004712 [Apatococcus lobatus]|uniref:Uncharacterized protein n=1 Tax=Apatococcus lobatus TaxID=904363 RepID=A0AAW1QX41_9CHLO